MVSPTQLFNGKIESGTYDCFFCGGKTENHNNRKGFVKPTFTNHDDIAFAYSDSVCDGCIATLVEKGEVTYYDGTIKMCTRSKIRLHTWISTIDSNTPYTKGHIQQIREVILNPPKPPFNICIATSGQKHLLFKSKVSHSIDFFYVQLEDKRINVDLKEFKKILTMADELSSVVGKKALQLGREIGLFIKCHQEGKAELFEDWFSHNNEDMYVLASYIAMKKEDAQKIYKPKDKENDSKNNKTGSTEQLSLF